MPASHRIWKPLHEPITGPPASANASTARMSGEKRAIAPVRRWSPCAKPPGRTTASAGPSESVACHTRRASHPMTSCATCAKSRSLQVPGKTATATSGRPRSMVTVRTPSWQSLLGALLLVGAQVPGRGLHHRVGEQAPAHLVHGPLGGPVIGRLEIDAHELPRADVTHAREP